MPSGRRCRSVRCNQTHYCYFHSGELNRKYDRIDGMHANYRLNILPVIEDRASIQIALNEIIRCYISDSIDSRKAGILLYGMNIALSNLRNDPAPVIAEEDAVASYQNIPEHDPIAELDEEEATAYAAEQKIRMDKWGGPDPTPNNWPRATPESAKPADLSAQQRDASEVEQQPHASESEQQTRVSESEQQAMPLYQEVVEFRNHNDEVDVRRPRICEREQEVRVSESEQRPIEYPSHAGKQDLTHRVSTAEPQGDPVFTQLADRTMPQVHAAATQCESPLSTPIGTASQGANKTATAQPQATQPPNRDVTEFLNQANEVAQQQLASEVEQQPHASESEQQGTQPSNQEVSEFPNHAAKQNLTHRVSTAEPQGDPVFAQLESAEPDTAAPDTAAPDTAAPETAAPETAAPDTAAPDTAAPDTAAPDTAAPDTAAHDTAAHDTAEQTTPFPPSAPLSPAARTPAPLSREGDLAPEPISSWIELPLSDISAEHIKDLSKKSCHYPSPVPIANALSPHLP